MSDNLWDKHSPSLKRLSSTFTEKVQSLSDKFQHKVGKKFNKWFNKNDKKQEKTEKPKENKQEKQKKNKQKKERGNKEERKRDRKQKKERENKQEKQRGKQRKFKEAMIEGMDYTDFEQRKHVLNLQYIHHMYSISKYFQMTECTFNHVLSSTVY